MFLPGPSTSRSHARIAAVGIAAAVLTAGVALAFGPDPEAGHEQGNYDARIAYNEGFAVSSVTSREQAVRALSALGASPDLVVTVDPAFGTVRTLSNPTGYVTGPAPGQSAVSIFYGFMSSGYEALGLGRGDVAAYEVTDEVYSQATGATRIWVRQLHEGLPVYGGQLQVNVNRDGRILSVNNSFSPQLAASVTGVAPSLGAAAAVASAAAHLGLGAVPAPAVSSQAGDLRQTTVVAADGISLEPIEARLAWLPIRLGDLRLVWSFQIATLDGRHVYDMTVDAHSGQVWTRLDWVSSADYRVLERPTQSPNHSASPPPADGRTLVSDPENAVASPLGWHDDGTSAYIILRGNNVHAYHDRDGDNLPPAVEPQCDDSGSDLVCDFPVDFTQQPPASVDAAVTNLFYWTNTVHDIQYQYGFDEAAGNFQMSNFGKGGLGADDLLAEGQDNDIGGSNCNASFDTPPDGDRPRMQMFTCNAADPERDGDFDDFVIVHEYGHGISNRQVGGPSNVSCLGNLQRMGEGISDWLGLVYTATADQTRGDARGGSYLQGQDADGPGIRRFPYSTDPAVNPDTYASIGPGVNVPHGVGSVWAVIAWEVYWDLVDRHGFDPDLADAAGGSGNQRAMLYFNQGLQNTICSPTFIDARDGVVQAAVDNYGGEDVCLVWGAFARRGLGIDATTEGPDSLVATNGFDIPSECKCHPTPIADAGADQAICPDQFASLGGPAAPANTYLWSTGATTPAISVSPVATTEYTVTATTEACGSRSDSATVFVQTGPGGLAEDFENGAPGWSATGLWHLADSSACADPAPETPPTAFYYGQDATCNYATPTAPNHGELISPVVLGLTADSTLSFNYWRRVERFGGSFFDVTKVDVVTGDGERDNVFLLSSRDPSSAAWTPAMIPLGAYAGTPIRIHFVFSTNDHVGNNFIGWFIDDVVVTGASCPLDLCPGTVLPESVPTEGLLPNHYALVDDDAVFDTVPPAGGGDVFTLEDTGGCSCEQIIDALGLGEGHVRHGCSAGVMRHWVDLAGGF